MDKIIEEDSQIDTESQELQWCCHLCKERICKLEDVVNHHNRILLDHLALANGQAELKESIDKLDISSHNRLVVLDARINGLNYKLEEYWKDLAEKFEKLSLENEQLKNKIKEIEAVLDSICH